MIVLIYSNNFLIQPSLIRPRYLGKIRGQVPHDTSNTTSSDMVCKWTLKKMSLVLKSFTLTKTTSKPGATLFRIASTSFYSRSGCSYLKPHKRTRAEKILLFNQHTWCLDSTIYQGEIFIHLQHQHMRLRKVYLWSQGGFRIILGLCFYPSWPI